jgi:hypothetical protein
MVELTPCIEVRKTTFLQLLGGKIKFETLQTVKETLFAKRKTKVQSNYPSIISPAESRD